MSLVNINNARSIEVEVASIQMSHANNGQHYIEPNATFNELGAWVLDLGLGSASVATARAAQGYLNGLLLHTRTLYSLQAILNDDCWQRLGITVQVEARVRHTGHGDIDVKDIPHIVLLVKTTWQES